MNDEIYSLNYEPLPCSHLQHPNSRLRSITCRHRQCKSPVEVALQACTSTFSRHSKRPAFPVSVTWEVCSLYASAVSVTYQVCLRRCPIPSVRVQQDIKQVLESSSGPAIHFFLWRLRQILPPTVYCTLIFMSQILYLCVYGETHRKNPN